MANLCVSKKHVLILQRNWLILKDIIEHTLVNDHINANFVTEDLSKRLVSKFVPKKIVHIFSAKVMLEAKLNS